MRPALLTALLGLVAMEASAVNLFTQTPLAAGGLFASAWNPSLTDTDQYVWDDFMLGTASEITEIDWRGGYINDQVLTGPVTEFTVAICASMAGGWQPDVVNAPLVQYTVAGTAGETLVGTFGGKALYDYSFVLPVAFQVAAGTRYWVQIEATQPGVVDWGIAAASTVTPPNNPQYYVAVVSGEHYSYMFLPGGAAFTLIGIPEPASLVLLGLGALLLRRR